MSQGDINRETELQNLLKDERERCNQYKQIYQTLKVKHSNLQDELTTIYEQLKEAVTENDRLKSSHQSYIRKLESRLKEKENEINLLSEKLNLSDPSKIRESVLNEASQHYEVKIKELNSEADHFREQYNTLHYEHAVMKCQLESRESEYSHSLDQIKLQHLNEIQQLQTKIELLEKDKSLPADSYVLELASAKREILQQESKLKVLLSECEELRAQNENLSSQINSINRTHGKQVADNMTAVRSLESEKVKLSMQKEVLERELSNCQEHRKMVNKELHESRRETFLLQGKLMECEHKYRLTTTNLQVEIEQLKTEQESEREQLMEELNKLKTELIAVTDDLSKTQQISVMKEQEYQQNLMTARQQLWKQTNELNREKDILERKLLETESNMAEHLTSLSQEMQLIKQNLQTCTEVKMGLEKEVYALKNKLEEMSKNNGSKTYEDLCKEHSKCKSEIQELREKIVTLNTSRNEILQEKEHYLRDVLSKRSLEPDNDREILLLKLDWEQQKHQFYQKLDELESQLRETRQVSASEKQLLELKIRKYCNYINKLKEKLTLLRSKNEELETQKEALKNNVPEEVYLSIKRQYSELQKRVEEFGRIVTNEPNYAFSKISVPTSSDKMLSDIKNLQVPMSVTKLNEGDTVKHSKENLTQKSSGTKKFGYRRKQSLKSRDKAHIAAKITSPVISSSSDTELENL